MDNNDTTIVLTDIRKALRSSDSEAETKPACLVGVGGELNGAIFDLLETTNSIGRNPDNIITLDFNGVSRYHFKIEKENSSYVLHDLGSRNGTFLNNKKVEEKIILNKSDIIKIGSIAFKFIPEGDSERLAYDKLYNEANTDMFTGCFNKTYFNKAIDLQVKKSILTGNPLSLILFDLDHFKNLNDNHGHDAGDYVLKEMSDIIRKNGVRDNDIFARYGGEEFVILLPLTNLKQSFEIAERLRKLLEEHDFIYANKKLPVTASIGVADYRAGVENGTDLFKRSDKAVYKAKDSGRNQVCFYKA